LLPCGFGSIQADQAPSVPAQHRHYAQRSLSF
jgi:hypothetical protein